jgi:hypothetical protein
VAQVRFVVMNNVFRTELELHRKFDLKGSTWGRTAGPRPGSSCAPAARLPMFAWLGAVACLHACAHMAPASRPRAWLFLL